MGCASSGVKNPSGAAVTQLNADERGKVAGLGIESQDLVRVCDKMARGILDAPQISRAVNRPSIVLDPVVNLTHYPINKELFLDRIRILLNSRARDKVVFLARDAMKALEQERELKRAGQVNSSADPKVQEFKGADFLLTGQLAGMNAATSSGKSEYIMYSFKLVDMRTSEIVWEDFADIKKEGQEDAAYR